MTNGNDNQNAARQITLGEKRLRVSFNPSSAQTGTYVDMIKQKSAELIDLINDAVASPHFTDAEFYEWQRLKDLAITAVEEGAMWGVKAATI